MIRTVDIHEHAQADLRKLRDDDLNAAAPVLVTIEQIRSDPAAIDKLTTYGNNSVGKASLNVKQWMNARQHGSDLWRFRILDTAATTYRVVYGYHYQTGQICILAVVHKDLFDYDDLGSEVARRILDDWRAL